MVAGILWILVTVAECKISIRDHSSNWYFGKRFDTKTSIRSLTKRPRDRNRIIYSDVRVTFKRKSFIYQETADFPKTSDQKCDQLIQARFLRRQYGLTYENDWPTPYPLGLEVRLYDHYAEWRDCDDGRSYRSILLDAGISRFEKRYPQRTAV